MDVLCDRLLGLPQEGPRIEAAREAMSRADGERAERSRRLDAALAAVARDRRQALEEAQAIRDPMERARRIVALAEASGRAQRAVAAAVYASTPPATPDHRETEDPVNTLVRSGPALIALAPDVVSLARTLVDGYNQREELRAGADAYARMARARRKNGAMIVHALTGDPASLDHDAKLVPCQGLVDALCGRQA